MVTDGPSPSAGTGWGGGSSPEQPPLHAFNWASVIAALRRGNLAASSTDVGARVSEIPATSAGMTESIAHFTLSKGSTLTSP